MAKFAVVCEHRGVSSYTFQWLKYMVRAAGLDLVPPEESDIILVSVCDVMDLHALLGVKKFGKPIIVGGADAFNDLLYSLVADLVNVGEGWEMFDVLGTIGHLPAQEVIEKLKPYPFIAARDKPGPVVPSTYIDWMRAPVCQVGPNKKMILSGRGCHNKCRFCFTSWTTKYQTNPILPSLDRSIMTISNDNSTAEELDRRVWVRSLTTKTYLGMSPRQAKNCNNYRFGIESFSEERRKWFGKPIPNADLGKIFRISKKLGHTTRFFIIAGIDPMESVNEFLSMFPPDLDQQPPVIVKATYFDPALHTPLAGYDMRTMYHWDTEELVGLLRDKSHRFRLKMAHDRGLAMYRTSLHRCLTEEEVMTVAKWKGKKYNVIVDLIESRGWTHLFDQAPPTKIQFDWRKGAVRVPMKRIAFPGASS